MNPFDKAYEALKTVAARDLPTLKHLIAVKQAYENDKSFNKDAMLSLQMLLIKLNEVDPEAAVMLGTQSWEPNITAWIQMLDSLGPDGLGAYIGINSEADIPKGPDKDSGPLPEPTTVSPQPGEQPEKDPVVTRTESVLDFFVKKSPSHPTTAYEPLNLFLKYDLPNHGFSVKKSGEATIYSKGREMVFRVQTESTNITTVTLSSAKGMSAYTFTGGDRDARNLNSLLKAIGMKPIGESCLSAKDLREYGFDDDDINALLAIEKKIESGKLTDLDDVESELGYGRFDKAMLRDTFSTCFAKGRRKIRTESVTPLVVPVVLGSDWASADDLDTAVEEAKEHIRDILFELGIKDRDSELSYFATFDGSDDGDLKFSVEVKGPEDLVQAIKSHSNSHKTESMKTTDIIKAVESTKTSAELLAKLCEDIQFTEGQDVFVARSIGCSSLKGKFRGLANGGYAKVEDNKGVIHTVLPHYIFPRTSNL